MTLLADLKNCPLCNSNLIKYKNYISSCDENDRHFSLHLNKDLKVKFLRIMSENYYIGSNGKNINIYGLTYLENDYTTEYITSIEKDPSILDIEYILEKAKIIKLFS